MLLASTKDPTNGRGPLRASIAIASGSANSGHVAGMSPHRKTAFVEFARGKGEYRANGVHLARRQPQAIDGQKQSNRQKSGALFPVHKRMVLDEANTVMKQPGPPWCSPANTRRYSEAGPTPSPEDLRRADPVRRRSLPGFPRATETGASN